MSEQWLSIVEYARTYSVSDMTVRRRIKTGKLHAVLREGKYYIPVHEVGAPSRDMLDDEDTPPARHAKKPVAARPAAPPRQVVKSHPMPNTRMEEREPRDSILNFVSASTPTSPGYVPSQIKTGLQSHNSLVETQTLLAFCDNALRKLTDAEAKVEDQYRTKISQLEAQLKSKDMEINHLSQQVEDLQVLVKILERKQQRS